MALSTRDVMFALRAQDFASRRIGAVGSAFNRLGKQMEASKARADEAAKSFQRAADQRIQPLKDANTQLARQNETMKKQVAGIKENTRVTRSNLAASKSRLDAENALLKTQSQGHKSVIDQARSSNQAIREGMKLDKQRSDARIAGVRQANQLTGQQIQQQRAQIAQITRQSQGIVDGYKQQNASIRQNVAATKAQYGETSKVYQQQRMMARGAIDHNNRAIAQEQLRTREALRARSTTLSGLQATHQAREREIAQLQRTAAQSKTAAEGMIRDNNQLVRQRQRLVGENQRLINSNTRQSAEEARAAQARIRHNEATIAGLNRRIRRNEGVIASNNRLAQTHQQAADKQIANARREEESIQRQIAARQQLAQRMMMGGAAAMMMGAIMTGIGTKIVSSFASATRGAAEFQHGLALAHTQIDQTAGSGRALGATVDDLTSIAMRVGREVPAAMEELPQTLFFIFTALNATLPEAEKLLRGFAQEAVAGNASVEASARSTIAIINGMNYSVDELTRVQDFQFQTVRKGVITYEQLSKNIGKVIPPLRRMGQEVEVGGAMLAFLTRQGLSAEMAATSAARSLELFSDPRVIQRLESQGVTMRNNAGEFAHFGEIINDLAANFDGLTGPERAEAMREIFGGAGFRIQARRFLDTVFASEESLAHFNQQIEWAENNTGAFAQAFANMSQEPQVRLQELGNQFFVLRHQMGVALLPVMESIIDRVKEMTGWFHDLSESSRANVVRMAAFAAAGIAVVGALTMMAGMLVVVSGMLVMMGLHVGTAVALVLGFIPAVAALAAIFGVLAYNGFSLVDTFKAIFGEFNGVEGAAKAVAIALGLVTVAFAAFTKMGVAVSISGISAGFATLRTRIMAVATAMRLFAATNPLLLALVAATTLAIGVWRVLGHEARQLAEATGAYNDALREQVDTITTSVEGFKNYSRTISDTVKNVAELSLREKDLMGALRETESLRGGAYFQGIANENGMREETLGLINAEIEALEDQFGIHEKLIHGKLKSDLRERRDALVDLRNEYNLQSAASDQARLDMIAEMRMQEGLTGMVGEYLHMRETLNTHVATSFGPIAKIQHDAMRQNIIDVLAATGALEQLSDAELENLGITEDMIEGIDGMSNSMAQLSQQAQNLSSVMGELTGPASAWTKAMQEAEEANSALEEPLDNVSISMSQWISKMEEGEATSKQVWSSMAEVVANNTEPMKENAELVYTSILAMGEAAPEAMEMLASADPEEFLEILRHIRLNAAWTSEEVQGNIDLMLSGMQAAIEKHGPDIASEMDDLGNALAIMSKFHSETISEDIFPTMIEQITDAIAAGKKPSEEEMILIGQAMTEAAKDGGAKTVQGIADELGVGVGVIREILRKYNIELANGINPVLMTLGKQTIQVGSMMPGSLHNTGGFVPGTGPDRDSVLAGLTPGEFVIRRKAVEKLDPHALHELNRTGDVSAMLRGYNAGGWVQPGDLPKPPSSYRPPVDPLTRPADATATHGYEQVLEWLSEQIPPLSEGVGWQAMWQAVNKVFGGRVNLHSALRPGAVTATGNPSYHGMGRAIDITPDMGIFNWIKSNYGNSREIIYSPAGAGQVHNGRNHMYSGITRAMHWDHIHWAMANGGMGRVNEPTWFLAGESGPEDFAFAPAGGSRKVGDGPGIGANMDVLDAFMRNTSFQNATDFRMGGIQTIQSAFSALASYEQAQQALQDAYKEVDRLGKRSVQIASEIEQKELQLSQLAKNRVASAQEELNILQAQRRVRDAQWDLGAAKRGVHELNNELAILRQEMRIEEMRKGFSGVNQEVIDLTDEVKNLRTEAKEAEKALEEAWKRASQVSIEQERNIINAGRAVREAKNDLEFLQQGLGSMSNELQELQQEIRVEDLREALAELQRGASETELQELADNVQSAADDLDKAQATYAEHAATLSQTQAEVTRRRFELAAVMEIAPNLKRETDKLLAQYRAEAKLADAQKEHAEAQEQYTESAEAVSSLRKQLIENENALTEARNRGSASARELRIAEIELALAERELLERQRARRFESEDLRLAEIALTMAEEGLTEAIYDSTAATNEVIEAQRELDRVQEQLAATSKSLEEAKKSLERGTGELRIAEIELALAEEELLRLHEVRKHEGEALKEAQWNLTVAQEGLTEAVEASRAPTQEMIDLEQQLHDLYQEQKDNAAAQIEARKNITNAELEAINATVGLIKAGQELAKLTPSQLSFFNQIAKQSGVATKSINDLNLAISTLSGAGVQDPRTRLQKEIQDLFAKYKVPLTYGTSESGSARVKRLADEILMGKRSMSDLERSVQIMAAQMQGISLKAVQAGMYDSGGVLRPGVTIATNNTGQNEFVFTADQLKDLGSGGKTVIVKIDEGSVQINVDGNVTEDALPELEEKIGKAFDEFKDDLYHTLSRY